MAAKSTIAKRYARAFVETFSDVKDASEKGTELEAIVKTFSQDPKFDNFLKSPAFNKDEKWAVLTELLKKLGASTELSQFTKVVLDADRLSLIADISVEYTKVLMHKTGEAYAVVESAYALTESELLQVQSNLEKTLGKKLKVKVEVKPELMAGLKVHVDGKTLDGTLASHLEKLQKELIQAEA